MLNTHQRQQYQKDGYIVLEKAIPYPDIRRLKSEALKIVDAFDIGKHRSVFTTSDRDSGRDDYFFDSAENIHCFLEEDALDKNGTLQKTPRLAINKIGHALHDLNPIFNSFCR